MIKDMKITEHEDGTVSVLLEGDAVALVLRRGGADMEAVVPHAMENTKSHLFMVVLYHYLQEADHVTDIARWGAENLSRLGVDVSLEWMH